MGTDEVFAVAKTTERFDRRRLKELVVDLWTGRGAELTGKRWAANAVWKRDEQERFGYAIGPDTAGGWITIVESAGYSLSVDAELLDRIAKATPTWVCWSCDHASLYGQKRLSKSGESVSVDLGDGRSFEAARGERGWEFLTFRGARPLGFRRFNPSPRTKSDPTPKDPKQELESALIAAVQGLRIQDAIAITRRLGAAMSDFAVSLVFDPSYPIEYEETSAGVAAIGAAIASVRPLDAASWARLLEVAAVRNDADLGRRAAEGLSACGAKLARAAVAEAQMRFVERRNGPAKKRFEALLLPRTRRARNSGTGK